MIMHELCNEYAIICNYMQWMFVPWYIAEPYNASYFDCSHAQHDNSKLFPREFKMDKFNWILFLKALQSPVLFLEGLRSSSMNCTLWTWRLFKLVLYSFVGILSLSLSNISAWHIHSLQSPKSCLLTSQLKAWQLLWNSDSFSCMIDWLSSYQSPLYVTYRLTIFNYI